MSLLARWWVRFAATFTPPAVETAPYGVHLYREGTSLFGDRDAAQSAMFVLPRYPHVVFVGTRWASEDTPIVEDILSHEALHLVLMAEFGVEVSARMDLLSNKFLYLHGRPMVGGF